MSSDPQKQGGHDEHKPHALPISLLIGVWVALMFLTWLTVFTANLKLGEIDFFIAMVIATVKVSLVCLVFMHLWWDKAFHSVLVVSGVLLLFLFLGATLFDRQHYQDSIDAHERDHPFPRRFPVIEHVPHEAGHGAAEHTGEGEATQSTGDAQEGH